MDAVIKNMTDDEAATLFLPTDIAFTFFVEEAGMTVEEIIAKDGGEFLTDVLAYHVMAGVAITNITEVSADNGTMFEAANGEMVRAADSPP